MRARKADCAVAISLAFEGLAGDPKQKIIKKNKKLKTSRNCCVTTSTTDQAQKADKEYSGTYGNGWRHVLPVVNSNHESRRDIARYAHQACVGHHAVVQTPPRLAARGPPVPAKTWQWRKGAKNTKNVENASHLILRTRAYWWTLACRTDNTSCLGRTSCMASSAILARNPFRIWKQRTKLSEPFQINTRDQFQRSTPFQTFN